MNKRDCANCRKPYKDHFTSGRCPVGTKFSYYQERELTIAEAESQKIIDTLWRPSDRE